ncbi:trihelix transcription factor GT-3b-like [Anopheles albimanus]|uniref:Myb/SANT-like DNA-binding domain-containing protein n=1 Tax=Anopheles albimanus TaxID=7167 RepID=A0A182FGU4_ANOAL|nr:trihelix transcription factor GT-3b-like [Anopheles albimanus]
MSKENRRNVWKYEETKEMLQIMLENNFVQSFSTKHNINVQIYRQIEKLMIERGFRYKTYEQIAVRWKNLKNLHMRAKRSDSPNERQLFPYYDEMDELLALTKRRPRQITIQPKLPAPPVKAKSRIVTIKAEPIGTDGSPSTESIHMEIALEEPDSAPDEPLEERLEEDEEPEIDDLPVRAPRTRIYSKRRLPPGPKRPNRLQSAIAASKQDLSEEFFRTQKRLIDYEFSLHAQREEEYMQQINLSTKELMEQNMEAFFVRLREFLDEQRAELADEETPR